LYFLKSPHTLGTAVLTACFSTNLAPGIPAGTTFDHFFIIVLENTDYATTLQQPYMKSLTTHTNPSSPLTHPRWNASVNWQLIFSRLDSFSIKNWVGDHASFEQKKSVPGLLNKHGVMRQSVFHF
jgi:hypothetical protein